MQQSADYSRLDDPALFAELRHVREQIAALPEHHPGRDRLCAVRDALTSEFDRRARIAWQHAR